MLNGPGWSGTLAVLTLLAAPVTGCQQPVRISEVEVYRYAPDYAVGFRSRNLTIEQIAKDSLIVSFGASSAESRSQYAYWTRDGGAQIAYGCAYCEIQLGGASSDDFDLFLGPESENIQIEINPEVGYTMAAGLSFEDEALLTIQADGIIQVDSAGIRAKDRQDRTWVSRKVRIYDEDFYLMVSTQIP